MARRPDPGARKLILDNAERLFKQHGVRAVGLQQIIDECGCGKSLLYREFESKDDLVVSFLERSEQQWWADVAVTVRRYADDPAGQLVAVVRAAVDEVTASNYQGCPLRNTYANFPEAGHPAHQVAVNHVDRLRVWLRELGERAGARDPQTLADQLLLIIDGVYINGGMLGATGASYAAVSLAEQLVHAAIAPVAKETAEKGRLERR